MPTYPADADDLAVRAVTVTAAAAAAAAATVASPWPTGDLRHRFPLADLAYERRVFLRSLSPGRARGFARQMQRVEAREASARMEAAEKKKEKKKRTFGKRWSATAETWKRNVRGRVGSVVSSTAAAAAAAAVVVWRRDSKRSGVEDEDEEEKGLLARQGQREEGEGSTIGYEPDDAVSYYSVQEQDLASRSDCWQGLEDDEEEEEDETWPARTRVLTKGTCLAEWEAKVAQAQAQRFKAEKRALSEAMATAVTTALHQGRFDEHKVDLRFAKCSGRSEDPHRMRTVSALFREESALQREEDHREWMRIMNEHRTQHQRWAPFAFWKWPERRPRSMSREECSSSTGCEQKVDVAWDVTEPML
nr:hypothetical protein CFP56_09868 [Quercus suber]